MRQVLAPLLAMSLLLGAALALPTGAAPPPHPTTPPAPTPSHQRTAPAAAREPSRRGHQPG